MSEIEDLRRDVIELREWQAAIVGKCKASNGFDSMEWGGDKEGWGFIHYFIGHLETRALHAESVLAEQDRTRTVAQPSPRCGVCGSGDTMTICEGCWTRQPVQGEPDGVLREALTLGRDAVMESFDYVKGNDDQLMADARLRTIDAAIAALASPAQSSWQPETSAEGLEEIIADLRREKNDLRQALQFIADGYENHDVNHVDYRVKVYQVALDALAPPSTVRGGSDV